MSSPRNAPSQYSDPYVVAEIGCNHMGRMSVAKELIQKTAEFCQIPCVKFQKRCVRETLTAEEYERPHPVPDNSYGQSYGEHRDNLEFTLEQHRELKDYCAEWKIAYSCSVWDLTSAREIISLAPDFLKIPSACNTHFELAGLICDSFGGAIHVSLGMTTAAETESIVEFYRSRDRLKDVVLYHCTSGYPVDFEDINLLEIVQLKDAYGADVLGIGFSGHHRGIAIDLAAYALGATYIERHLTLDRTLKGTDHAASLEPDGIRRLARDLIATQAALRLKPKDIIEIEVPQRAKLKWDRNQ